MFLYIFSKPFNFPLKVYKLADKIQYLNQAAIWAEEKWGYIRGFKGVEKRKEILDKMKNNFYVVLYHEQLIGMFALKDAPNFSDYAVKHLMYFYVDENFRNLGVGSRMLVSAKKLAALMGSDAIVLDTLTPNLNKFYQKHGAKIIGDSHCLGFPTTMLIMSCKKRMNLNKRTIRFSMNKIGVVKIDIQPNAITLKTKRLTFKSFDQENRDDLIAKYTKVLRDQLNVSKLLDGKPWSDKKILNMIRMEKYKVNDDLYRAFSVYEQENHKFIGCLCIDFVGNQFGGVHANAVEIGYFIDHAFWGKGYGTEMASIGVEYIEQVICDVGNMQSLNTPREAIATTHPDNPGSRKILEKILPQRESEVIFRYGHPRLVFFKPLVPLMIVDQVSKSVKTLSS